MKLTLVGTGLIGGAFALAAKQAGLFQHIDGLDQNSQHARRAQELGLVDAVVEQIPEDADAVLLAVPSSALASWVQQLATHPGIVFDVGSVKGVLLDQIRERLGALPANFVPCHPIAGLERSGPSAARADLFQDHVVVLTPTAQTNDQAVSQVNAWWQATGARVEQMDAWQHDRTFATTSHLPHLVAFAYMQQVTREQLDYAAGGFRDFSRIAAADPDMWTAILQMNAPAVTEALSQLQLDLAAIKAAVASGDTDQLRAMIERSQLRRRQFEAPDE